MNRPYLPPGGTPATARWPERLGWVLLLLLVLSPTHTKLAGLLWLLAGLTGISLAMLTWRKPTLPVDPLTLGARQWLLACTVMLALWQSMALYWQEPCCTYSSDINSGLRLWLAALATYGLVRHWHAPAVWSLRLYHALALACVASLWMVLVSGRFELPSYPIPWSASVAMLLVLLFPAALKSPAGSTTRRLWLLACGAGVAAVLLSQSRGAYVILGWMVYAWARSAHGGFQWRRSLRPLLLGLTLAGSVLVTGWLPSDPLRMREAWNDLSASWRQDDYNNSLGGRLALYELAASTVAESPWTGVGARERLHRIRTLGLDRPEPERSHLAHARTQGHVHNAYLHHAMDGGVISLLGFMLSIAGLWLAARTVRLTWPQTALQLQGLTFVHAFTSVSNVNHAHNYYAVMLSLSVLLAFVLGRCLSDEPSV